jgi:bifunctional N-acetylglucosamine-1-phosphate-uridyltransferase/glucosamine-1-phosphate-acetyltransferase GlmU-like protein
MGKCRIGEGVKIMPGTWIKDSTIAERTTIGMGSIIEGKKIKAGSVIAPYSQIR